MENDVNWNRWYATKSYLRSALWTAPLIALVLEQIAIHIVSSIDTSSWWVPELDTTVAGAAG